LSANLRPATPDDAGPLAELIYSAALANARFCALDLTFGTSGEETLERLRWTVLNLPENPNSFSRFTVAEVDGRVAAALCLHQRRNDSVLTWRRMLRGMGYGYAEIGANLYRMRSYFLVKPSIPRDSLIVGNIATFPEFRRMGAARALLEDAVGRAGEMRFPRLDLECQVGNPARLLYEGAGFEVTTVKCSRSWEKTFGTPGVLRMTLDLSTSAR
jgi:ribosomal protein S18 acetylase RimI-like enzyme